MKITEEDQEVYLEIEDNRLIIEWLKLDKDGKVDTGASFAIPLKPLKELIDNL